MPTKTDTEPKTAGRLANILNNFRQANKFGGTSYGFFYLTNECNYACDMCYMDSKPGLKNTRLNPELSKGIMREFQGIDEIIISGGEITILPYFAEQIQTAAEVAGFVTVFTNGTGFVDRSVLRQTEDNFEAIRDAVKLSMEEKLQKISPNVEITIPVTAYHLVSDSAHKAHKYHEAIVTAGATLAREWFDRNDRPKIRFIAKNTPGQPNSGQEIIDRFGIQDLGSTGAAFPGGISKNGRGVSIMDARNPSEVTSKIEGGIHINHQGVFANEPSLLQKLHLSNVTPGEICSIESSTSVEEIVNSVVNFVERVRET